MAGHKYWIAHCGNRRQGMQAHPGIVQRHILVHNHELHHATLFGNCDCWVFCTILLLFSGLGSPRTAAWSGLIPNGGMKDMIMQ